MCDHNQQPADGTPPESGYKTLGDYVLTYYAGQLPDRALETVVLTPATVRRKLADKTTGNGAGQTPDTTRDHPLAHWYIADEPA